MKLVLLLLVNISILACDLPGRDKPWNYQISISKEFQSLDDNCEFIKEKISSILSEIGHLTEVQLQRQVLFSRGDNILSIQIQQFKLGSSKSGQISINLLKY